MTRPCESGLALLDATDGRPKRLCGFLDGAADGAPCSEPGSSAPNQRFHSPQRLITHARHLGKFTSALLRKFQSALTLGEYKGTGRAARPARLPDTRREHFFPLGVRCRACSPWGRKHGRVLWGTKHAAHRKFLSGQAPLSRDRAGQVFPGRRHCEGHRRLRSTLEEASGISVSVSDRLRPIALLHRP